MERKDFPYDSQDSRFSESFAIDQEAEIKEFFNEYGVVVIRDVLTSEECQATVQDIIRILEDNSGFRYNDPSTWNSWPANGIERYGQAQREPYMTKHFMENRQNPNVLRPFSYLYNTPMENLIINQDRGAMFRPATASKSYKTKPNLHLDLDPWGFLKKDNSSVMKNLNQLRYGRKVNEFIFENNQVHSSMYGSLHLQAGINLLDNEYQDGGFICVPGFANYFNEWANENKNSHFVQTAAESNSVQFPAKHWLNSHAQRITMKAGSMVIWDQRTPHGSAANESSRFRSAQFLKVFPNQVLHQQAARRKARRATVRRAISDLHQEGFVVSE
eukprot:CAMPEP_0117040964 /NCGR_PEP_ID=MMETSP0472-20121206/28636_1 /TAXON_ID=693140 ORGANISM="Tiarina fusus, Strain LIS" /NCGR_SAMPLE_ID=MMETSP0472 /ASSEMBLY_ACC=CAM_ASM_000603 /LENGTH=329 /DNA_ID=CAMNT_0004751843 /DNA_START=1 /DNA_END=987 /DNA_ORIENTATION=+